MIEVVGMLKNQSYDYQFLRGNYFFIHFQMPNSFSHSTGIGQKVEDQQKIARDVLSVFKFSHLARNENKCSTFKTEAYF